MKTINLLPQSQKKELELEFISHQIVVFWIMVMVTLVLFVGTAWVFKFYVGQLITSNDKLIENTKHQLDSDQYKQLQDQIVTLNGSVAEIKNINNHHYNWSQALLRISELVEPNVQINQINMDAATGKIDVAGQAKDRQDVIDFWSNVTNSQYFEKINFPLTNLEKPTDANFTFTFYAVKEKFANPK